MKYPVLVLNADYLPHRVIDWKTAITLVYSKGCSSAHVSCTYDDHIKDSMGRAYNLPAVIVLNEYVASNNKVCPYSKRNIMLRDRFTCQYCGKRFSKDRLTIDHVVPKSRPNLIPKGVKLNSFENCVTACNDCNSKKADRTLSESKMKLIRQPKPITKGKKVFLDISYRNIPKEWCPYLEGIVYND